MGRDTKDELKKKSKKFRDSTTEEIIEVVATAKILEDIYIHGPISHKIYDPETQEYMVEHQGPFMANPSDTRYIFLRVDLFSPDNILVDQFKKTIKVVKESPIPKKLKRYRLDLSERIQIEQRIKELESQGLRPVQIKDALFDEKLVKETANPFTVLRRVHRFLKKK